MKGGRCTLCILMSVGWARSKEFHNECSIAILGVRNVNLTKTNVVEKGIGQLLLKWQFNAAIRKYFKRDQI